MAKRINTYKLLRIIHFYTAALTGVFLLLFFITGYLLTMYNWFDHEESEVTVTSHELNIPPFTTEKELARWAKQTLEIDGKIDWISPNPSEKIEVEIVTPKTSHLVKIQPQEGKIIHETRPQTPYESISVYHRVHGYGGGFWYDVYLVAMDLASISLLVFSITGIYLWLKVLKRKLWGWIFLITGMAYTGWIIWTFIFHI